jgi:hypothetical protein
VIYADTPLKSRRTLLDLVEEKSLLKSVPLLVILNSSTTKILAAIYTSSPFKVYEP